MQQCQPHGVQRLAVDVVHVVVRRVPIRAEARGRLRVVLDDVYGRDARQPVHVQVVVGHRAPGPVDEVRAEAQRVGLRPHPVHDVRGVIVGQLLAVEGRARRAHHVEQDAVQRPVAAHVRMPRPVLRP